MASPRTSNPGSSRWPWPGRAEVLVDPLPEAQGHRRARAQTRSGQVARERDLIDFLEPRATGVESLRWSTSMSNTRSKFEPTFAARQSRHVAFLECHVNICLFCPMTRRAFNGSRYQIDSDDLPAPRSANRTDRRPVPHPRSSADPRGTAQVSSARASNWSNWGIIVAASDSHGVKPTRSRSDTSDSRCSSRPERDEPPLADARQGAGGQPPSSRPDDRGGDTRRKKAGLTSLLRSALELAEA